MSLLKYVVLGAAAVYGFKYATRKRAIDGKSFIDDLRDQTPDYLNKAKKFGERMKQDFSQTNQMY
ncbi:YtxH domain-containing protein [Pedobacter mendelii]|uniref:YtxH domain-containing protein n=1 Tax=Pedobacter mendelii TaxID=1908240 RepID=A0ABQ2BBB8_9SPHI|nr:YtxH domain-containing protein [Pedobacter mendelii]GGI22163.1 hypothetical protein GCM10008119_01270 [Pedobacter mendelii]